MMWIKPGYIPPTPDPPREDGKRLAEIPRGNNAVLRVTLQEYEGRPYLALRVWEKGQDGKLYPCKGKGCSIRISEIPHVQAALARDGVEALVTAEADRPTFVDPRRRWTRRYDQ